MKAGSRKLNIRMQIKKNKIFKIMTFLKFSLKKQNKVTTHMHVINLKENINLKNKEKFPYDKYFLFDSEQNNTFNNTDQSPDKLND